MSTPAFRLSVVSLLPLAAVAGLSVAEGRAPSVEAVRFNIVTEHAADTLSSDGMQDDEHFQYADFRLSTQPTPPPVCVDAQVLSVSGAFLVLNRKMDDTQTRCSDVGGTPRNWTVVVEDSEACQKLWNYDSARVDLDLDAAGDAYSPCRLNGADNPRIRVGNVYARKLPATTPVALLITSFNPPAGHGGFEIRSVGEAAVQGTSTVRTVNYHGTARLFEFIGKAKAVASPFRFDLHMTLERTVVP